MTGQLQFSSMKIPTVALLGLSFTGCGSDGIAGSWRATEFEGMPVPFVEMDGDRTHTTEGFLVIGEDLKGELQIRERSETDGFVAKSGYDIAIEVEAMGSYFVIKTSEEYGSGYYGGDGDYAVALICDLSGDRLECTALGGEDDVYKFVRED